MTIPDYVCEFTSTLRCVQEDGGWVFADVPKEHAPTAPMPWGRTPVRARVDGRSWDTSVWRTKDGDTALAVPRKIRGGKGHGDSIEVRLEYSVRYRT